MNNPIVIGLACAVLIAAVVVWIQIKTYRLNKKRRAEGKEPVGPPPPVDVIDWTNRK